MEITLSIRDDRYKHVPLWLAILRWTAFAAILFGPGLLADSAAMQWSGFLILIAGFFAEMIKSTREKLTIDEARKRLDELEAKRDNSN